MQRRALEIWNKYLSSRAGWVRGLVEVALSQGNEQSTWGDNANIITMSKVPNKRCQQRFKQTQKQVVVTSSGNAKSNPSKQIQERKLLVKHKLCIGFFPFEETQSSDIEFLALIDVGGQADVATSAKIQTCKNDRVRKEPSPLILDMETCCKAG